MPALSQPSARSAVVAAFDFDGTLTRRDTLGPFLVHVLGWPRFLWVLLLCSPWLAAFMLGLISNHLAKARLLKFCLSGKPRSDLLRKTQEFVSTCLPKLWNEWGLAQLLEHQKLGHCCVIVSASPGLYLHEAGRLLGVDAVLCTELEESCGFFTGLMASPNCHGEEKVRRLRAWLGENFADLSPTELHAYGDSRGDLPMLAMASHRWYRGKPWRANRPK